MPSNAERGRITRRGLLTSAAIALSVAFLKEKLKIGSFNDSGNVSPNTHSVETTPTLTNAERTELSYIDRIKKGDNKEAFDYILSELKKDKLYRTNFNISFSDTVPNVPSKVRYLISRPYLNTYDLKQSLDISPFAIVEYRRKDSNIKIPELFAVFFTGDFNNANYSHNNPYNRENEEELRQFILYSNPIVLRDKFHPEYQYPIFFAPYDPVQVQ